MGAHTVITHALKPGARMWYTGTQSWGPASVTVVKPWGGHRNPLYVVAVDGERGTYVVAESDLEPLTMVCPDVYTGCTHTMAMNENGEGVACVEWCDARGTTWVRPVGVTLAKASDDVACVVPRAVRMSRYLPYAWMLRGNDLDGLSDWFALRS